MNAKELMIGDWVEPDQSRTPTAYTSVAMITTDGVYMNEAERLFSFDELHGVFLSPDVLERAGFRYGEYDDAFRWGKGDDRRGYSEEVTLIEDNEGWICEICGPNCDMEIEEFRLQYVHQLQHLMRCVGITKEIKI